MAQADVHYFDQRTGERVVAKGDWHGPFWWSEGNGSNDSNRCEFMYGHNPRLYTSNRSELNLIIIEKIVCKGKIVYQEPLLELPLFVVAMIVSADKLSVLCRACRSKKYVQVSDLQAPLDDLKEARRVLLSCAESDQAIKLFDTLVNQVKKAADCIDSKAADDIVNEELSAMQKQYLNFTALLKAVCKPFKSGDDAY